jgi:hypothetical protein
MGGIVSSVADFAGDVVGGVGGAIGSVANQIPVVGPYVGPIISGVAGGGFPAFASSLAFNAATGKYGGGGGGSSGSASAPKYAQPTYNYGANSYQMGNNPVDTSKYFITGDKGVYNLLPALGQINPKTLDASNAIYSDSWANSVANAPTSRSGNTYYTPYEAYNDLSAQMAKDPKALAAFQAMYQPTTPASKGVSPYVDFGLGSSLGNNATYKDIASYASTNQNPFYVPFNATGGKTATFTPPHILEAQKKAEAKARFERLSPEKQQERLAAQRTAMSKLINRVDPNSTIRNAISSHRQNMADTPKGIAGLRRK